MHHPAHHVSQSIVQQLIKTISIGFIVWVMLLNLALWLLAHQQIHKQTDEMLYQLAILEARLFEYLPSSKENLADQDEWVEIPSWTGGFTKKFRLVLDQNCQIIQSSPFFKHFDRLPKTWCEVRQKNLFTIDDGIGDLRMGRFERKMKGNQLYFLVGIEHQNIDRSTWLLMLMSLAFSILLLVINRTLIFISLKNISLGLSKLSEICEQMLPQFKQNDTQSLQLSEVKSLLKELREFPSSLSQESSIELQRLSFVLSKFSEALENTWQQQERFMAIAAHELKTPLTAILGEIEITLRRPRKVEEYKQTLELLLEDGHRLEKLTKDLLTIARLNTDQVPLHSEMSIEDFSLLLQEIYRLIENQLIAQNITLDLKPLINTFAAYPQLKLRTTEASIWHIIFNLIQNSIQHAKCNHIDVFAQIKENILEIHIKDNGKGIPPQVLRHLFQPFQKGNDYQGHGLGLYIAKTWIQKLGGELYLVNDQALDHHENQICFGTHWCVQIRLIKPFNQK
jgi:signal transduction histidine kinase